MTLREIDALVAENVMGWRRMTNAEAHPGELFARVYSEPYTREEPFRQALTGYWHDPSIMTGNGYRPVCPVEDIADYEYEEKGFHPSSDIAAAWQVFCKFTSRYLWYDDATDAWHCHLDTRRCVMDDCRYHIAADEAAEAICLAALRAVGVEAVVD